MPNTFSEKVTRFTGILDKKYIKESVTAFLEKDAAKWVGTNKIKVPSIEMDGAADYDRTNGYTIGGIDVDYEEYELEFDRGRKFSIDVIDDDETGFSLYQEAAIYYVTHKEVPEVDAVRFSRWAARAGTVEEMASFGIDDFDDALTVLSETTSEQDLVAFVSTEAYTAMKKELTNNGRWSIDEGGIKNFNRRYASIEFVPVIQVPKERFYDAIEMLDGTSTGQEAGGYQAITGTTKKLHLLMGSRSALNAYTKRNVSKIFTAEQNQLADAYTVSYRNHFDAIIYENQRSKVYVAKSDAAIT